MVTSLEMTERPTRTEAARRHDEISGIWRAQPPSIAYYRFLYHQVGEPWYWHLRRNMCDEVLRDIIEHPQVEVYVLYVRGTPAGYVELDRRVAGETEIVYLGLMPECIGRGLGPALLDWGIERAWRGQCRRVWVHTCSLDHPAALAMYQRVGLRVFRREEDPVPVEHLERAGFDWRALVAGGG